STPEAHPRRIATGTVEAGDKAELYRIGAREEDNWNSRGGFFCRHCRRAVPDDRGYLTVHHFSRKSRQPVVLPAGPAVFDRDVLPLNKANFPQALVECGYQRRRFAGCLVCVDKADKRDGLLRARRERPRCRRAADKGDELAPFHSITSSARASSVGGIS